MTLRRITTRAHTFSLLFSLKCDGLLDDSGPVEHFLRRRGHELVCPLAFSRQLEAVLPLRIDFNLKMECN